MKLLLGLLLALSACTDLAIPAPAPEPSQRRCGMSQDEYEIDEEGNIFRPDYPGGTVEVMEDAFEGQMDLARQHGYGLPKPTPYNEWTQLSQGKTIGKRANLGISIDNQNTDTVNLLEVGGPDLAAIQLCITLIPPQRIYNSALFTDRLNATGSQSINDPLEPVSPPDAFPGTNADVFAIIEWGIGGVQASAEVDFNHGTQINIQASWVRLRASARMLSGGNELLTVGAFVGPGSASSQGSAQRSIYPRLPGFPFIYEMGTLAPGAKTAFMPVPNFAKRARVIGNIEFGGAYPVTVPHIALEYHLNADPAATDGLFNWALEGFALFNDSYPVPSGANFVRLHNYDGALNVAAMGVVFDLCL